MKTRILLKHAWYTAALVLIVGLVPARATASPPLRAPWSCQDAHFVTQGHNFGSHKGKGAWAWDIEMPVGTPVTAPASGVVRAVRDDSERGGCSADFAEDANYVIVAFDDGTEALLLHLEPGSARVKVGDYVEEGDVLAAVGETGWVCGAHLHLQVQEQCESWWCQSVPAEFEAYGSPQYGDRVPSQNCPEERIPEPILREGGVVLEEHDSLEFSDPVRDHAACTSLPTHSPARLSLLVLLGCFVIGARRGRSRRTSWIQRGSASLEEG